MQEKILSKTDIWDVFSWTWTLIHHWLGQSSQNDLTQVGDIWPFTIHTDHCGVSNKVRVLWPWGLAFDTAGPVEVGDSSQMNASEATAELSHGCLAGEAASRTGRMRKNQSGTLMANFQVLN